MNIIMLIFELILNTIIILYFYKKYKYEGLYISILMLSIILTIVSQKQIEVFNLELNLGFIQSSLIIIISNILIQNKGPKEISKIIAIIIISTVSVYTLTMLTTFITTSSIQQVSNDAYNSLFYLNNRIFFATIISLLIAIYINSILYHQIRQDKNKIIISNSLSQIVTNLVESIIFALISYTFKLNILFIIEIIMIRYLFKLSIGLLSTSTIYIVDKMK